MRGDGIMLNINGLVGKIDQLGVVMRDIRPAVAVVVESHTTDLDGDELISLEGYNHVRCDTDTRYTGGIVLYLWEGLSHKVMKREVFHRDWWILEVQLFFKDRFLTNLLCVYRSPSGSKSLFIEKFSGIMDEIAEDGKTNYFIVGDFNIDLMKGDDCYVKKLLECVLNNGFKQIVMEPTRITKDSATMIDLVITDNRGVTCNSKGNVVISDHELIVMTGMFQLWKEYSQGSVIRGKVDNERLKQFVLDKMSDGRWLDGDDMGGKYVQLRDIVLDGLRRAKLPDRIVRNDSCPWLDAELRSSMGNRDMAYGRFRLMKVGGGGVQDVNEAWESYKGIRNRVIAMWRKKRNEYYGNFFMKYEKEPKKLWKILKSFYSKNHGGMSAVQFDEMLVEDPEVIAEKLNEFFVNSIEELFPDVEGLNNMPIAYLRESEQNGQSLTELPMVSLVEIKSIVDGMRDVMGSDGVSVKTIKCLFSIIGERITEIVNDSFRLKKMPKVLKTSKVSAIPKVKGSRSHIDLRPVNNLQIIEKIIEAVFYKLLINHVNSFNLLNECQSGFRRQHSTETAVQFVVEDWRRALDGGEGVVAVFLDFKRAFETIDRELLLRKLECKFNVSGDVLEWLNDYLHERVQKVSFGGVESGERPVKRGVPQGSKLGPLLFIMYINDLPEVIRECCIHFFADDTLLYVKGVDVVEMIDRVNRELQRMMKWLRDNSLVINVKKTKCMAIGRRTFVEETENRQIYVNSTDVLDWVKNFKYLGVIFDDRLKFCDHVRYVVKKMARRVNIIERMRSCLPRAAKEVLFRSLVASQVKYCSTIFFGVNKSDVYMMQKVFNRGFRAILRRGRRERVRGMMDELGYMPLEDEIKRDVVTFVFKIEKGTMPEYLDRFIVRNNEVHSYNTRTGQELHLRHVEKTQTLNTVFHRGLVLYNEVPVNIKSSVSVGAFREKVGCWLRGEQ